MVCSIFIASSTSSGAPLATVSPALHQRRRTLPGIGAFRPPVASSASPPACSVQVSIQRSAHAGGPEDRDLRRPPLTVSTWRWPPSATCACGRRRARAWPAPGVDRRASCRRRRRAAAARQRLVLATGIELDRAARAAVQTPAVAPAPRRIGSPPCAASCACSFGRRRRPRPAATRRQHPASREQAARARARSTRCPGRLWRRPATAHQPRQELDVVRTPTTCVVGQRLAHTRQRLGAARGPRRSAWRSSGRSAA